MSNITGVVNEVYHYDTKVGTMYGMTVNGTKYGCGKTKPKAAVGDTVSFRFTENGQYKNVDMKSFSVEAGVVLAAQQSVGLSTAPSAGGEARQNSIVRQSSLEYAIRFVQVLATADAIPGIGKTTKPEDKYNIIEALVAEKAEEFFNANIAGRGLLDAGAEGMPKASAAQAAAAGDKAWG